MTFTFDVQQPIEAHYSNTFTIEANSLEEAIAMIEDNEFDYNDYLDEESWDMIEDENDEDIRIYYGNKFIK